MLKHTKLLLDAATGIPPQGQYAQAERLIDDFNRLVNEIALPDGLLGAKVGGWASV